jgi:hypothetical protein
VGIASHQNGLKACTVYNRSDNMLKNYKTVLSLPASKLDGEKILGVSFD